MSKDYQPLALLPPEPILHEDIPLNLPHHPYQQGLTGPDRKLEMFRYLTFLTIGISLLWPWNCLITLSPHFTTEFTIGHSESLGSMFTSTMMTISTLTSLIVSSYLSTRQHANLARRILLGSAINIITFIVLAVLDSVATQDSYHVGYFTLVMFLVFVSSFGACLAQNGTMSMVQSLGPHMAQSVMVGQSIAGVLPSLTLMLSNWWYYSPDTEQQIDEFTKSTVLYLLLTSFVTLIAGGMFLVCENIDAEVSDFTLDTSNDYQMNIDIDEGLETGIGALKGKDHVHFITLFEKLSLIALAIFGVFLFSLVFPVFASAITSTNKIIQKTERIRRTAKSSNEFFSDAIFIPFIFFIWNLGDLSGRLSCSFPKFMIRSDTKIFLYSILRCVFIPLLFACNIPSNSTTPEDDSSNGWFFINSDLFYITLQFLFGFTNGHCLSLSFMNVGHYVLESEGEAAGAFCNVFLNLGLLAGSLLSYVFVWVV